jgi:hypothetical protein
VNRTAPDAASRRIAESTGSSPARPVSLAASHQRIDTNAISSNPIKAADIRARRHVADPPRVASERRIRVKCT